MTLVYTPVIFDSEHCKLISDESWNAVMCTECGKILETVDNC